MKADFYTHELSRNAVTLLEPELPALIVLIRKYALGRVRTAEGWALVAQLPGQKYHKLTAGDVDALLAGTWAPPTPPALAAGEARREDGSWNPHLFRKAVLALALSTRALNGVLNGVAGQQDPDLYCFDSWNRARVYHVAALPPAVLLRTRNFGRKSLHEVEVALAWMNLALGMSLPDFATDDWGDNLCCEAGVLKRCGIHPWVLLRTEEAEAEAYALMEATSAPWGADPATLRASIDAALLDACADGCPRCRERGW